MWLGRAHISLRAPARQTGYGLTERTRSTHPTPPPSLWHTLAEEKGNDLNIPQPHSGCRLTFSAESRLLLKMDGMSCLPDGFGRQDHGESPPFV